MNWVFDRLKEPSTWRGIIMILGGIGVLDQAQERDLIQALEAIAAAAMGSGLIGIFTKDQRD